MITYVSLLHVSAHKRALLRQGHTKTHKGRHYYNETDLFLTSILNIPFERYGGVQCLLEEF